MQDLFNLIHPTVIHFSIVGFVVGSLSALLAFFLLIVKKMFKNSIFFSKNLEGKLKFLENFSFWNILMAEIFLPVLIITGIMDAGGLKIAVTNDLLALKLHLSFFLLFISLSPIVLKIYSSRIYNQRIFNEYISIAFFYLIPLMISSILILLIASLGGKFTFNHTLFDNIGLGFLIPDSIGQYKINDEISFLEEKFISPEGIILYLAIFIIIILFPLILNKFKNTKKTLI